MYKKEEFSAWFGCVANFLKNGHEVGPHKVL